MANAQELVAKLTAALATSKSTNEGMTNVIADITGLLEKVTTLSDELVAALAKGQITAELEAAVQAVVDAGATVQVKVDAADALVPAAPGVPVPPAPPAP